jgi:PQQ-dependent catabolism-associated CXXCW motif protein
MRPLDPLLSLSAGVLLMGLTLAWQSPAAGVAPARPDYLNQAGYRSARYRAPTPLQVPYGKTRDTEGMQRLLKQQRRPLLIDVQAVAVRPELADFGLSWLPSEPRYSLPGSTWLPNVGYAELTPRMDRYFREQLERLTGGDKAREIVIFCVTDCWMSWNAVQRAHRYGYRNLYWYRDGTDIWASQGLPLDPVQPVPLDGGDIGEEGKSEALDRSGESTKFINQE